MNNRKKEIEYFIKILREDLDYTEEKDFLVIMNEQIEKFKRRINKPEEVMNIHQLIKISTPIK